MKTPLHLRWVFMLICLMGVGLVPMYTIGQVKTKPKASRPLKAKPAKVNPQPAEPVKPTPAPPVPVDVKEVVYETDLNAITNDQVEIVCNAPTIKESKVIYRFPAMVPGTYHVYDFGRWIHNVRAVGKAGQSLFVTRLDDNSWEIQDATQLAKFIYRVSDTFDSAAVKNIPFEPAGSLIAKDTAVLINTFCFTGYFDGYKQLPIKFKVKHAEKLTATSSLDDYNTSATEDWFQAPNYVVWADHPIYYTSNKDVLVKQVGNATIQVAVYDQKGQVSASDLYPRMEKMLQATSDFFGGALPVRKYSFLMYYTDKPTLTESQGALEHTTSSVYVMMSDKPEQASAVMQEIASHEFFHIITPLNIHSEEIGDFDFAKPVMSKHLWLYEGMTEYMSGYILFRQGVKTSQEYVVQKLRNYVTGAGSFNDTLPFTEMSLKVLGETERQYPNVYLKGPLINLCLDLRLRKLSAGKYGLPDLISALSQKYGQQRSFKDSELFDEIAAICGYPEIRSFFTTYVEGKTLLPLQEYLGYVGVNFQPSQMIQVATMGNISLKPADGDMIAVDKTDGMNEVGKALGYEAGDIILKLNDEPVKASTFTTVVTNFRAVAKQGDKFSVTVIRNGKEKKLKARVGLVPMKAPAKISIEPTISQETLNLWNAWSGNSAR